MTTAAITNFLEAIKDGHSPSGYTFERHIDELLVAIIRDDAATNLTMGRLNGRYGWWNDEVITIHQLSVRLSGCVAENDFDGAILYAGMLKARKLMLEYGVNTPCS